MNLNRVRSVEESRTLKQDTERSYRHEQQELHLFVVQNVMQEQTGLNCNRLDAPAPAKKQTKKQSKHGTGGITMDVREKLTELLREAPYNMFGNKLGNCYFDSCLALIADHLTANGVTVQEWISVKDRLPEDYKW